MGIVKAVTKEIHGTETEIKVIICVYRYRLVWQFMLKVTFEFIIYLVNLETVNIAYTALPKGISTTKYTYFLFVKFSRPERWNHGKMIV